MSPPLSLSLSLSLTHTHTHTHTHTLTYIFCGRNERSSCLLTLLLSLSLSLSLSPSLCVTDTLPSQFCPAFFFFVFLLATDYQNSLLVSIFSVMFLPSCSFCTRSSEFTSCPSHLLLWLPPFFNYYFPILILFPKMPFSPTNGSIGADAGTLSGARVRVCVCVCGCANTSAHPRLCVSTSGACVPLQPIGADLGEEREGRTGEARVR